MSYSFNKTIKLNYSELPSLCLNNWPSNTISRIFIHICIRKHPVFNRYHILIISPSKLMTPHKTDAMIIINNICDVTYIIKNLSTTNMCTIKPGECLTLSLGSAFYCSVPTRLHSGNKNSILMSGYNVIKSILYIW